MLLYNSSENLKIALRKEINEGAVSRVLEMIKAFKLKKNSLIKQILWKMIAFKATCLISFVNRFKWTHLFLTGLSNGGQSGNF